MSAPVLDVGHPARVDAEAPRRRGRPPGREPSREALLAAARAAFTAHGYRGATLRAIAADAGVDAAMVRHWFGGKQGLFAAVMRLPIDYPAAVGHVLDGPRDRTGERLVRFVLGVWDAHPELIGEILREAVGNAGRATAVREFLGAALIEPLLAELHVDRPRLRAELCATQVIGLAVARHALRFDEVVRTDPAVLVAAVGPTLQRYLTGRLATGLTRPPQ
jgi:AcrR family transcriptional regulator